MKIHPAITCSLLVISTSLVACASNPPVVPGTASVFGPGWQCLLVPTSFDGPGTIFSVDQKGVKYHVADLSSQPQVVVQQGAAAMGTYHETETLGSNIILSLLDKAIPGASASLSATAGLTRTTDVEYGDLIYEITYQPATDYAVQWFNQNVHPDNDTRYFFVREAYDAGSVKYDLSDNDVASLGGAVQVQQKLSGKGTLLEAKDATGYKLTQNFSPKLRTCILPYEFEVVSAGADGSVRWGLSKQPAAVPVIVSQQ